MDIQEKLTEGAAKVVPLGMDEFMNNGSELRNQARLKSENRTMHNDSGEFPDLLDSDNSLATLNSDYNYSHFQPSDDKLASFLKSAESIKDESGLTFTNLNGIKPEYPDIDVSSFEALAPAPAEPMVVAKKSVIPVSEIKNELEFGEQVEIKVAASAPEVKAEPVPTFSVSTPNPIVQTIVSQDPNLAFPIEFQQPIVSAKTSLAPLSTLPTLPFSNEGVKKEEIIDEKFELSDLTDAPGSSNEVSSLNSPKPGTPVPGDGKEVVKDTYTVVTESGLKVEVPTIVTGGYDFDKLTCLYCDNQQFKNDKTLINHLLNHFGVAPKMATCPICHLSLQKKSFARHVRLHGDVQPEVCPYCKKEFREKRSLDKHVRAIHEAERPFPCDHCSESFRNQIELKAHVNRHLKDHPYKCDVCSISFQKQEALTTHYRLHTGEKPFACEICDKKFTSEKNRRVHVLRHEGSLPHKCEVCDMTFQSKSHLIKHATSHSRKTQVTVAKINTFLESFGASLGEFGLDDNYDSNDQISLHPATESGEIEDQSIKLSMESFSETETLETAATEAALSFDANEDTDSQDGTRKQQNFSPSMSVPSLVNGLTEEEAEKMARQELSGEIPPTPDGTHLCQMCNTRLGNKRSYIIHLRRHAGMLNFKCNYCPKTFQGRVKLNRHMNTHFRDGVVPLLTSLKSGYLNTKKESGAVISTISEQPGLSCTQCGKVYPDKTALQEHTKMHLIEDAKAKFSTTAKEKKVTNLSRIKYERLEK